MCLTFKEITSFSLLFSPFLEGLFLCLPRRPTAEGQFCVPVRKGRTFQEVDILSFLVKSLTVVFSPLPSSPLICTMINLRGTCHDCQDPS